ncbi:response regulator transcription factor [Amycolatopsis sp. cmx-8-4]|uniref:response regulator n=1 Tax=Amycolatopsis sp. cmx-8-4 TaxID=2790947 RepID=UPI00397CF47F
MRSEAAGPPGVRVVVISGVQIYLQGLVHLLRAEEGFEVAGTASGVESAVPLLRQARVDVVLLDMTGDMAGERGLDALHRLAGSTPVPLVVLGIPDRAAEVVACVEAGIAGYVTNENSFADLTGTLRSATRGEFAWQAPVAARLVVRLAAFARERRTSPVPQLTGRELEITSIDWRVINGATPASAQPLDVKQVLPYADLHLKADVVLDKAAYGTGDRMVLTVRIGPSRGRRRGRSPRRPRRRAPDADPRRAVQAVARRRTSHAAPPSASANTTG